MHWLRQLNRKLGCFALALAAPLCGVSQTEIRLGPYFQHNMVLQRSANTLIYGSGPAGKSVHIRYKSGRSYLGPKWITKIEPAGTWQTALNLSSPVFESKLPGTLWISEEGKARKSFEITNVFLGDVWLVAGWEHQGVPAAPGELDDARDKSTVRFQDLRPMQQLASFGASPMPDWEFWPDGSQVDRFSTLDLRLAHLLAGGKFTDLAQARCVGIIRMRPEELQAGLKPDTSARGAAFRPEDWAWIQQRVREAQTNRWARLIEFKHQGVVTNEPGIIDYDVPLVFPASAFSAQAPPANRFSFKGAIWQSYLKTAAP